MSPWHRSRLVKKWISEASLITMRTKAVHCCCLHYGISPVKSTSPWKAASLFSLKVNIVKQIIKFALLQSCHAIFTSLSHISYKQLSSRERNLGKSYFKCHNNISDWIYTKFEIHFLCRLSMLAVDCVRFKYTMYTGKRVLTGYVKKTITSQT